jgi:tetratricopeptide (TPR) repeat protein
VHEQAKAIFLEASGAFEQEDYWRAIELSKRAIELEQERADYHHLLGRALSQNPNWKHEAEQSLRKAAELDPYRSEYLVSLGEFYRSAGLLSRAQRAFDKARSIDPEVTITE